MRTCNLWCLRWVCLILSALLSGCPTDTHSKNSSTVQDRILHSVLLVIGNDCLGHSSNTALHLLFAIAVIFMIDRQRNCLVLSSSIYLKLIGSLSDSLRAFGIRWPSLRAGSFVRSCRLSAAASKGMIVDVPMLLRGAPAAASQLQTRDRCSPAAPNYDASSTASSSIYFLPRPRLAAPAMPRFTRIANHP